MLSHSSDPFEDYTFLFLIYVEIEYQCIFIKTLWTLIKKLKIIHQIIIKNQIEIVHKEKYK